MPKAFCPDCGQPNQYSDIKPKYCGFCQAPLDVDAVASDPAPRPSRRPIAGRRRPVVASRHSYRHNDDDDDDYYDDEGDGTLPNITKLDLEIEAPRPVHRETVGEIWGTGATGEVVRRAPRGRRPNAKAALEKFTQGIFKKTEIDLDAGRNS